LQVIDLNAAGKETHRHVLQTKPGELWVVTGVAFTPDGKHLGAATFKPGAYFLDSSTLEKVDFVLNDPGVELYAGVTISADGKRMAFARKFGNIHDLFTWEPQTGRPPRFVTREKDGAVISAVAFAPGGRQIAHGGTHGGPIKLHDPESGQSPQYPTNVNGNVNGLAFSPDGRLLAATCSEGSVLTWPVVPAKEQDK
jgi:WD40 repeat protein